MIPWLLADDALAQVYCDDPIYEVTTAEEGGDPDAHALGTWRSSEALCEVEGEPCTLRAAINTANLCREAGAKWISLEAPGPYLFTHRNIGHSSVHADDVALDDTRGWNALPRILGDVTILGNAETLVRSVGSPCPVEGSAHDSFRFFHVRSAGRLTLDRLHLQGGCLRPSEFRPGAEFDSGGAVLNEGWLTARSSTWKDSVASNFAGALWNAGTATLEGVTLEGSRGYIGAALLNRGALTVERSRITGSIAAWSVVELDFGVVTFSRTEIDHNASCRHLMASGAFLELHQSTVSDNQSKMGTVLLLGAQSTIGNSTFARNIVADAIPGACEPSDNPTTMDVATVECGGEGWCTLWQNTIADNGVVSVDRASGLRIGPSVHAELINNLVVHNDGQDCAFYDPYPSPNVDSDGTCAGFSRPGLDVDLRPLSFYVGFTPTQPPVAGDPVVDAAPFCVYDVDQRDLPRDDGACDFGAVELRQGS